MTRDFTTWHFGVLLMGATLFATLLFGDPEAVAIIARQEGLIEDLTALFYFFGAAASLIAIYHRKFVIVAGLWLALCILFLGEETSWFQRFFNYHVLAVENISGQKEFNLHNLNFWDWQEFIGEDGRFRFSFGKLLGAQAIFRIGFFSYFLALPLLLLNSRIARFAARFEIPPMPAGFLAAIWTVVIASFILTLNTEGPLRDMISETREFFYAIVIFLYTLLFFEQTTGADTAEQAPRGA